MRRFWFKAMLILLLLCASAHAEELSMDNVQELAERKTTLTEADFTDYDGTDVGSGILIMEYEVGEEYLLKAGWPNEAGEWRARLEARQNPFSYVWLGEEDLKSFLESDHRIGRFSYEREAEYYLSGEPGVNPHLFRNVDVHSVSDYETALERAVAEVTIEYDTVDVRYDCEQDMWSVLFYLAGAQDELWLGGGETVYFGSDGITRCIVYGE